MEDEKFDKSGEFVRRGTLIVIPDKSAKKFLQNLHARYHSGKSAQRNLLERYGLYVRDLDNILEEIERNCLKWQMRNHQKAQD